MVNFSCTLQLLFLGLLVSPAFLQRHPCDIVKDTDTPGSFSLDVSPQTYRPGEIYTVNISGIDNGTSVILQARSVNSRSEGIWETENEPISCSSTEYLVQKSVSGNGTRTYWKSPVITNATAMSIRAFVTFANGTTLVQSRTLTRDLTTGGPTPAPPTTWGAHKNSTHHRLNATMVTHNWASSHQQHQVPYSSASTSQTGSVLLAALQVLPVFLGFKLLS